MEPSLSRSVAIRVAAAPSVARDQDRTRTNTKDQRAAGVLCGSLSSASRRSRLTPLSLLPRHNPVQQGSTRRHRRPRRLVLAPSRPPAPAASRSVIFYLLYM